MNALTQLRTTLAERYEVEREIGAGGTATVYLARDVKHDRRVALKVLNPELAAVVGVERFLSEIRVTANLQHPNLLPLFDSGEAGGLLFYTMPFVEGESLRVRLEREQQLPVDEAVRIANAVANALDYAHGRGIVHRDLKPENILLQHGQPVVADFGIALAVSKAASNRITQTGISLGTPQYMSPEQASGNAVIDSRSDVYSLAAVTYEMLTGDPPHIGSTAQAVIARVLTDRPRSIRAWRPAVPDHVEAALERALEKLPADRFSTAREFAEALLGKGAAILSTSRAAASIGPPASGGWRARARDPVVLTLAGVTLVSLGSGLAIALNRDVSRASEPARFALSAPDSLRPSWNDPWPAAISPDGRTAIYTAHRGGGGFQLVWQRTDRLDAHPIPGATLSVQPIFSPDGQWVAFEDGSDRRLKKVRLDGSAPIPISEGSAGNGADWTTNDVIVLGAEGNRRGLSHVNAAGGELIEFTKPDTSKGEQAHLWPIVFSDDKTIVFVIWSGARSTSRLATTSLDDGRVVSLDLKGIRPLAILDRVLVYVRADGAVMAIPMKASTRRTTGKPMVVLDPVPVVAGQNGNSGIFISRGGALIQSRGGFRSQMTWLDRRGSLQAVSSDVRDFRSPRLSPDGRRIAVVVGDFQRSAVWILEVATATFSRLTSTETADSPEWTADGKRVVFVGSDSGKRSAFWRQSADGDTPAEKLFEPPDAPVEGVISPDERTLLFTALQENNWHMFRVALDSNLVARPYFPSRGPVDASPRFSPDGRWVASVTSESGRAGVYVRSFPDPGTRVQVSHGSGYQPVWSGDGTRLYYRVGSGLIEARISVSPGFRVVSRDTVFARSDIFGTGIGLHADYDVSHDGSRILMLSRRAEDFQLVVAPNFRTELKQRLAGDRVK